MKPNLVVAEEVRQRCWKQFEGSRELFQNGAPSRPDLSKYENWLFYGTGVAWGQYALSGDLGNLKTFVGDICRWMVPLFHHRCEHRHAVERPEIDFASEVDLRFADMLGLYIAFYPRAEIRSLCAATSYGRLEGQVEAGMSRYHGAFCRMMRSFFLEDMDWLKDEIETLGTFNSSRDPAPDSFVMPKGKWKPLFSSLFFGPEDQFRKSLADAVKWNHDSIAKSHLTIDGEYHFMRSLNPLLMACVKIARAYKGMNVAVDSEFVPVDGICFE